MGLTTTAGGGRAGQGMPRPGLFLAMLRAKPFFAFGYLYLLLIVILAILAPLISPYDPVMPDLSNYLQPPNASNWLGTDNTGMDIATRIIHAPRTDLVIAVLGTVISALIGAPLGALVGYYERRGGWRSAISALVMRTADVLQAFPVFVFAIALALAVFAFGLVGSSIELMADPQARAQLLARRRTRT